MNDYERIELIKSNIGEFPDFPIKGILFKDIFTALTSGPVCIAIKELLINYIKSTCPDVDVIVGLEARGFLFSLLIAAELGVGCVPIRKKGKLPGKCVEHEYALEYGTDIVEIQAESIKPGQKVVIVDDLLATGGTLNAACSLIEKLDGHVKKCIVIMELKGLNGRSKITNKVHSFISYD